MRPGTSLGRVGVAVVLDALHEAARAVPDAGDGDTDASHCMDAVGSFMLVAPSVRSASWSSRSSARSARRSTRDRAGWTGCGARGATGCSGRRVRAAAAARVREPLGELRRAGARGARGGRRARGGGRTTSFSAKVRSSSPASSARSSSAKRVLAAVGDAVRLAGAPGPGVGRPAHGAAGRRGRPSSEPVAGDRRAEPGVGLDALDRAVALEPAQRRIERAVRDAPERSRASRRGASSARSRGAAAP